MALLDANGNLLSLLAVPSYTYNSSNEITVAGSATYTYDNNGNTLTKTDATGTTTYTWDFENRLTSVHPPNQTTVTFKYDPFGRRIQKGGSVYVYDAANLIEEADAGGRLAARYVFGSGIDEPLATYRGATWEYYQADGLGSITSLTTTAGTLSDSFTYDSFGNVTSSTGTFSQPFRYTGREWDAETGLYYYRARYYDPSIGRFISEDPIQFDSGQNNFYEYVGNSPIKNFDPTGLARCIYNINEGPNGGWISCHADDPRNQDVTIPVASGNNGDNQHHCKNNPDCAAERGHGPIPPGWWRWGGISKSHASKGGRHLYPIPGSDTDTYGRDGLLTHSCLNPSSNEAPASGHHYCSEGCITGTKDDINALNKLLDAEPNSILFVTSTKKEE